MIQIGNEKTQIEKEKTQTGNESTKETKKETDYVTLRKITNGKILETLKKSLKRAQLSMIDLEVAEDLKELKKWEYMNQDEHLDYSKETDDEDSEGEEDYDIKEKQLHIIIKDRN